MKTTMDELFSEFAKDYTPKAVSLPGMDLEKVAREMDKKLDKLMEKAEEAKEQPEAPEAPKEQPKAPQEPQEQPEAPKEQPEEPGEGGVNEES